MRPQGSNVSPAKRGKFSPFLLRGGLKGQRGGLAASSSKGGFRKRKNSDSSEESSAAARTGKQKRKSKNNPNYGDNPNKVPLGKYKKNPYF